MDQRRFPEIWTFSGAKQSNVRELRFWMAGGVSVGVETGMRRGEKERRAPSEWQADIMHGT